MDQEDAYTKARKEVDRLKRRAVELGIPKDDKQRYLVDPWELRRLISDLQGWRCRYDRSVASIVASRKWRLLIVDARRTLRHPQACLRRQQEAQLAGRPLPTRPIERTGGAPINAPIERARVGVWIGDDQVLHLSAEVGRPAVWPLSEFAARARYRSLIGIKRVLRRAAAQQ